MSKYFSENSHLIKNDDFGFSSNETPHAMPLADNLTTQLNSEKRNLLSEKIESKSNKRFQNENNLEEDYIENVISQSEQINEVLNKYTEQTKQNIENKFNKFSPAEMFEKMNQLIYVVTQLSNKIQKLEETINNDVTHKSVQDIDVAEPKPEKKIESQPTQIKKEHNELQIPKNIKAQNNALKKEIPPMLTADEIRTHLASLTSGKGGTIPVNDYLDQGVNLEELFPHLDDEAYQAGYSAMLQAQNKVEVEKELPTPGNMRGIVF